MELIVLKTNLKEGITALGKIGSENASLPILKNCLIETHENKIKFSVTNLEMAISSVIPAKVIKDGNITVPLSILSSIINNLESERVSLETKNNNLVIKTENYQAKIQGTKKEEFPIIPKIENEREYLQMESGLLKDTFLSIITARQGSAIRPELGGVLFDYQVNIIKFAATDSFRLAERTIDENSYKANIEQKLKIIVPLKTIQELVKIMSEKDEEKISIYFDSNQILFRTDKFELVSRVINGDFPDYQPIIPKETAIEVMVNRDQLINALKLTGSFSDKMNEIRLIIKEGVKNIELFSANPILGENQYLIPAKIKGDSMEIVFNWKFLFDGIKNIETENITIGLNGDNKPAIIRPMNVQDYFYIIMPINNT